MSARPTPVIRGAVAERLLMTQYSGHWRRAKDWLSPVKKEPRRELDLNCAYLPFRVPSQYLDQFIEDVRWLGIRGLSVTIPHKESVLKKCDWIDGAVKGIGAVNTLVIQENGIYGYNTDYRAAMACLDERLDTATRKRPLAGWQKTCRLTTRPRTRRPRSHRG